MRSDIIPGGIFPDYELPDHTDTVRTLSELQGDDPMILTLARGHYCPKEHQQHLELAAFQPKLAVAYTQIVTIATDEHHTLQEFRASVGAQWTFLSDPGRTIQKDLDIQEYTDPEHDPMIPHTLVLKPGLVIHSVYNGYWFWGRPSVDDLWRDLRAATSEIRPDWDLSTPGLREAWDAGDWSLFHGWDRPPSCCQRIMNKTVVVATDGSVPSQDAIGFAVELASEHSWQVVFVHVIPTIDVAPDFGFGDVGEAFPHEPTEHDHVLLKQAAGFATDRGVAHPPLSSGGRPPQRSSTTPSRATPT